MATTKIEWAQQVWNPITGCTKISAGCKNCYAELLSKRLKGMKMPGYEHGFDKVVFHPERLGQPEKVKKPTRFFVGSMTDMFHDDVVFDWLNQVFKVVADNPRHTFIFLTKRPERMLYYFRHQFPKRFNEMPENVWLGTTVEHAKTLHRIDALMLLNETLALPATKFLSVEPLLEHLIIPDIDRVDWVIVGGESGMRARPIQKEWVESLQKQCDEKGVKFFFNQWGTFGEDGKRGSKKTTGYRLNGVVYDALPNGHNAGLA